MTSVEQRASEDMLASHHSYLERTDSKCHCHQPLRNVQKCDKNRLIIASVLCLLFLVIELVGGIISNSLALITDAAHLLTDFGAFLVGLTSLFISEKKRTRTMNFGFHRAEVLGALISILSIWLLTGILLYVAVQRLVNLDFQINSTIMLTLAAIGLIFNLVLGSVLMLRGTSSGSIASRFHFRKHGVALRAAFIHILGDFVHSTGLLIASLIIYFAPDYKMADPICTVIFSVIILVTTLTVLKDIFRVLMEGVPKHISLNEVHDVLFSFPQVSKVHDLRMWSLTLDKVALSAHIVIKKGENPTEFLQEATAKIYNCIDVYEITLQIEEDADAEL